MHRNLHNFYGSVNTAAFFLKERDLIESLNDPQLVVRMGVNY